MATSPSAAHTRRSFLGLVGAMGAAAALTGSLAACGTKPSERSTQADSSAKETGTITAGISYELGTNGFDPMTTTAALTVAANWHTMEGLTEISPVGKREVFAALGSALPKKVDDKTYEVTLRDGAKFHDGSDVTTDDVVYSFERVLDPKNESLYATFIAFVDKVSKKDAKTVTIKLKYPFTLVAERIAVVKIVPKAAVSKDAKAFDAKPIGTGPYKMTDNSSTSKQIVFERFDGYTGQHPAKAAKMVWKIMPDDSTRQNALSSKSIQAMDLVPDLSVKTLQKSASVESVQGFSLLFAMFNCGSKPFDDVRNRQGILYAIDMKKVVDTAYLGNATPATSFVQESHPAYKKAKVVYTHNQAKAKEIFGQTGLNKVRLLCSDHAWVKKATPIIKQSLEAAGLQVEFSQKKSSDVYNTIDGKPDAYDIVIAPGDPSVFGADADLLMRWWYAADTWADQRMHWKGQDSYKKVQTLLDDAAKLDGDAQKKKWGELFDLISETVPLYPLFHRKATTAWDKDSLPGFAPISLTGLSFVDVGSSK
ncbi:ABC transporter substrate-binding protein [Yimella sp. RIT 621]|uniref:ABC transporter substrate-binding protein n=1 Tax=Yimella sp. RIT 621 TaxID=2510323 RepID=UPI00101CC5C8|nr:ABC transporter substrate-binding protein [Yimella sp. RIT 621]RYG76500.1 ABC transporter substrate-binding protein [Yimella sp. RIT 621]